MIEQLSLQTVLTYLTLISVPIGVFYHIMTLRNTRRNQELTLKAQEQALETRQLQLYTTVFQPAQNREFMLAYIDVLYKQEWEDSRARESRS